MDQKLLTGRAAKRTNPRHDEVDPVLCIENSTIGSKEDFELLTLAEVANLLKISNSSVRRMQQQRDLPFFKVGGSVRFSKSDIATYLASNHIKAINR